MVVFQEFGQQPPQMPLVQDDEMVQAFAAGRADESLGVRVLPRGLGGRYDFFNSEVPDGCPGSEKVSGTFSGE